MDNIYDIEWMFHYKVYIAKSDIHGVGLRAINDIKKGEKVFYYRTIGTKPLSIKDLLSKNVSQRVIDVLKRIYYSKDDILYVHREPVLHHVNFMNHSFDPNMIFDEGNYIAKRDIKADEEVTLDFTCNNYHSKLNFTPKNL